jgi:hypothetical protein
MSKVFGRFGWLASVLIILLWSVQIHCTALHRQQLGKPVEGIEEGNAGQVVERLKTRNQGASDSKPGCIEDKNVKLTGT